MSDKKVNFEERYFKLLENKVDGLETKIDGLKNDISFLVDKFDKKFGDLDDKMERKYDGYNKEIEELRLKVNGSIQKMAGWGAGAGVVGTLAMNILLFLGGKYL